MPFAAPIGAELVEHRGAGTMFDVALVQEGGAVFVCKRLSSRTLREPVARAALAREIGLLERARHDALPRLVRFGEDEHGPFLLESLAAGLSLRGIAEALRGRSAGGVPGTLVAGVAARAAAALAAVHALADPGGPLAIVHGDLGPDHVFCGEDGKIQFVDFGAARFRGMGEVTSGDQGTLPFAAPEVARGDVEPGQPHDVYALAATIVAFGTGAPLVATTTDAAMLLEVGERGVQSQLALTLEGLDAGAREALRDALAFDPRARLTSARELADRIDRGRLPG